MSAVADRSSLPGESGRAAVRLISLACALSLALGVTLAGHFLVSSLALERRLFMHRTVLAREALAPYQHDMYLVALICQWLQDHAGLTPLHSFTLVFAAGYLLLFVSLWFCLTSLYRQPAAVLLGLFALAAYACILMPYAFDHPADPFGAAFVALTLAGAVGRSPAGMLVAAVGAGFFWSKHALVAPIVLLYEGRRGRWLPGAVRAALVVSAALLGPACYRLPPTAIVAGGILTPLEWVRSMPLAALYHLGFALPPLLSLLLRERLHPMVRSAAWLYPLMIVTYAAAGLFIHELRSFWPVVPVFAVLVAAWGEGVAVVGESGPALDGPEAPDAPARL